MINIVTDTTAVLPHDYYAQHDVTVVPQTIRFGEETFQEGVTIDESQFLQRLKSSPTLPATAAPAPGLFAEVYRRAVEQGDTVLSLHPSNDLSGTVASAYTARQMHPDGDIRVIDMRTAAGCLGEAIRLTVEWRDAGLSADDIEARLQALIPRSRTYFLVATLEYLQRNGRIGGASRLIGSMLQIKPILQLSGGHIEPLDRVRTQQKALERLKELAAGECPHTPEARLCVMHADVAAEANQLREELRAALDIAEIPLYSVGPAIIAQAGPGILGVGFYAAHHHV